VVAPWSARRWLRRWVVREILAHPSGAHLAHRLKCPDQASETLLGILCSSVIQRINISPTGTGYGLRG